MKLKVSSDTDIIEEDVGTLYLVLFELEGKELVKIGVTSRNIEDRVAEILVSIFKKYREFPRAYPKRFRKVPNVYEKEAMLHKHFKDLNYKTEKKFSGSTEFFEVPLDDAVVVYESLIDNGDLNEFRADP